MIEFNLKAIIQGYNRKHLHDKLTIAKLSRLSGISRHSLSKLCGKYRQSKGVTFDTLNRLIKFFGLPVSKFISYVPDTLRITLFNTSDKIDAANVKHHKNMIIRNKSTLLKIQSGESDHANLTMAYPAFYEIHHHWIFLIKLYPMKTLRNNLTDFIRSANESMRSYVYARIIAHSGDVSRNMINHADDITIVPVINNKMLVNIVDGLNRDDLLIPKPKFKTTDGRYLIIDKSSNQFK